MSDLIDRILARLREHLHGRLSTSGDERYAQAVNIWPKPIGDLPRAIAHCRSAEDVQHAIRAARDCGLRLSVRGGGHDWEGRALCDGLVIDLSGMRGVIIGPDAVAAVCGGARALDVAAEADALGLAPVSGACGAVGVAGLTLGGGYGPLIGRFGLALDNLVAAEVVLADGRIVVAKHDSEEELFWALRGGGGNFGVVTAMWQHLHPVPSVRSGLLIYPFAEACGVLQRCVDLMASAPDELEVQMGFFVGPDGVPMVMVLPTWSGAPERGEAWIAPYLRLGTLLTGSADTMSYGARLTVFDPFLANGLRTFMDNCRLSAFDGEAIGLAIDAVRRAAGPGCAIITHEFKGAAARVHETATAFGLRRPHVLVEILSSFADRSDPLETRRYRDWTLATRNAFGAKALPGAYPNFLAADDRERAELSYGQNARRLIKAKRRYDPDNVFRSAMPLPKG